MRKRFFNYLVFVSQEGNTILEERKGKGIWQGLYQFPLIETNERITAEELLKLEEFQRLTPDDSKVSLHNQQEIIHKLSHQHLDTRFWIIQSEKIPNTTTSWEVVKKFAVPVLISNLA